MLKVGAIIPVYNAAECLRGVIEGVKAFIRESRIIVVDDGSTDRTAALAEDAGAVVLRHDSNKGKGEALKSGFRYALESGLDAVITIDGDGQHPPDRIPDFIEVMERTGCDIVVGRRRFKVGEMPPDRIFSNRTSSRLSSWAAGTRILDSQCGYRMIRSEVIRRIHLATSRFETETELLVKAAWEGFSIDYCPIPNSYEGEGSHIRRLQDTVRFCKLILALNREKRKRQSDLSGYTHD